MSFETTRRLLETAAAGVELPFPAGYEGGSSVQTLPAWGAWSIMQGETMPAIIGPGHVRGVGVMILQIFVKEGGGTAIFYKAADAVSRSLNTLQVMDSQAGELTVITLRTFGFQGSATRDGYQQKNLSCEFQRDTYTVLGYGEFTYDGVIFTYDGVPFLFDPS